MTIKGNSIGNLDVFVQLGWMVSKHRLTAAQECRHHWGVTTDNQYKWTENQ
jgi:hypothetical protein